MAELTRKKAGMGSGNMSTPATTSSNASSSGYGYAPMFEAMAQALGYSDSAAAMAAAAADTSGSGTPATTVTGTDPLSLDAMDAMSADALEAQANSIMNPTTVMGVDVEKAGLGAGVSLLTNLLAPTPFGILGLAASTLAKKALETSRLSYQDQMIPELQARWGQAMRPVDEQGEPVAPGDTKPADAITAVTEEAVKTQEVPAYTGAKVTEEDDDPLGTWIANNVDSGGTSQTSTTPSQGPNTGEGSGFNSAGWGSYSSSSSSDSGSDSSSSSSSSSD